MYTNEIKNKLKFFLQIFVPVLILASAGCPKKFRSAISVTPQGDVFIKGVRQPYLSSGLELLSDGCALRIAEGGIKFFSYKGASLKEETFILPESPVTHQPREIESAFSSLRGLFVVTPIGVYRVSSTEVPVLLGTKGIRGGTRYKSYFERIDKKRKVQQYIGTSFNGIYTKSLESSTWTNLSKGLHNEPYARSYRFYEGIHSIFELQGTLYCFAAPLGAIYRLDDHKNQWIKHSQWDSTFPAEKVVFNYLKDTPEEPDLFVSSKGFVYGVYADVKEQPRKLMEWGQESALQEGVLVSYAPVLRVHPSKEYREVFKMRTKNVPAEIRSLYVNLDHISSEKQKVIVSLLKDGRFNSVVINLKDDSGRINYLSQVPLAKKIGAVRPHPKLKELMAAIAPYNPYVIARIVVFKDNFLQRYNAGQYAIWDSASKSSWRINSFESWVDPYNKEVVDYNISIAQEIVQRSEELRIDEIQFDYVRLPADTHRFATAVCRSKPKDWTRYDLMENFFRRVYKEIEFHVSVDVYGYNAIYEMGNIIGQDAKLISKYVPTICPMYYPSHFGSMYLAGKKNSQAYETVHFGTHRANYWTYEGTQVRPYIQGFRMKAKYNSNYIQDQVRAARDGGSTGFSVWNVVSDYKELSNFLPNTFLMSGKKFSGSKSRMEQNGQK